VGGMIYPKTEKPAKEKIKAKKDLGFN